MNKKVVAVIAGLICFVLMLAIVIQIRTVQNIGFGGLEIQSNDSLMDDLLRWKEKCDNASEELKSAEDDLEATRKLSIQNNPESQEKEAELSVNNMALGLSDVEGQGIVITLTDNQGVTNENIGFADDIRSYLVHDANLREIVRKLKVSGAEAISINNQRIVGDTAITCSGNIIRVNGEKVGSPFEIKAIGSKELLYGNITQIVERLNNSGIIVNMVKQDEIRINKYDGVISFNIANSL